MKEANPIFDYLTVLAVIQPARIQDIEHFAPQILPSDNVDVAVSEGLFRLSHENARNAGLVVAIRRGTYFLTPKGREIVRTSGLHKEIDNIRLFLMKAQRKRYR